MKPAYLTFLASLLALAAGAQNDALYDISVAIDPLEVRMLPLTDDPQPDEQHQPAWVGIRGLLTMPTAPHHE